MAFCSKCGTELTEGAKFCPKCGNPNGNTQVGSNSYEGSSNTGQFDQNNQFDNAEGSMFNYKYICIIVLCLIAFAFLFLWALAHDSDNGGGLYTYISLISILGVLVLALLIYLEQLTKSIAIKTTLGIVVYFALMAFNVPIASEEFRNERKARDEQKKIEQKQESAAERQKDKINEIKRRAEREGRILAQSVRYTESWLKHCQNSYISAFGTPSTDEDYKMYDVFKEEFRKSYFATLDAQQKMN